MRPNEGGIPLWPAAVVGFLIVIALAVISPVLRLNAEPPSGFVGLHAPGIAANAATASAYWKIAVNAIQWKYSRGVRLPEQVPEDFRLPVPSGKSATAEERAVYWSKLREEWLKSENWHRTYTVDISFVREAGNLWHEMRNFITRG